MIIIFTYSEILPRVGDSAFDGRGCDRDRRGKIDLGLGMAHPADEVTVGGGDTDLTLREDTHVAAETCTARRGADGSSSVREDVEEAFFHRLFPYVCCGGGGG